MGQKGSKKGKSASGEMGPELLDMYIRSEFRAMDSDQDDKLSRQETLDLLILLGYSKGKEKLKALHVKSEDSVELEDYVKAFKADKTLINKTQRFRQVFKMFDKDSDGTATKQEVMDGLAEVDIKIDDQMKKTIEKMDTNADGKISYQEFLTMELKIALHKEDAQTVNSETNEDQAQTKQPAENGSTEPPAQAAGN